MVLLGIALAAVARLVVAPGPDLLRVAVPAGLADVGLVADRSASAKAASASLMPPKAASNASGYSSRSSRNSSGCCLAICSTVRTSSACTGSIGIQALTTNANAKKSRPGDQEDEAKPFQRRPPLVHVVVCSYGAYSVSTWATRATRAVIAMFTTRQLKPTMIAVPVKVRTNQNGRMVSRIVSRGAPGSAT